MELLYALLVFLLVARVFGELAERLGQPVLTGELLAGILFGVIVRQFPDAFPGLASLPDDEAFKAITNLGVFFLMLLAGVELRPRDLLEASKGAAIVAIGGMIIPLGAGFVLGWWFLPPSELKAAQCLFLGVALAITAVPVSVKVLMDLGKLKTRMGKTIVSAAVYDDIASLLLLSILTALLQTGEMPGPAGLLALFGKVLLFFASAFIVGRFLMPYVGRLVRRSRVEELELSFLIILALGFGVLADRLGMHFILGSFVAGLLFGRRTIDPSVYKQVRTRVTALSTGFLAPIFFVSIGLHTDLSVLTQIPVFVLLLIAVASFGKIIGAGAPARITGLSLRESIGVGVAMNARGAVELIIAGIALRAGLFEVPDPTPPIVEHLFAAIVLMAAITTVSTPILLNRLRIPEETR